MSEASREMVAMKCQRCKSPIEGIHMIGCGVSGVIDAGNARPPASAPTRLGDLRPAEVVAREMVGRPWRLEDGDWGVLLGYDRGWQVLIDGRSSEAHAQACANRLVSMLAELIYRERKAAFEAGVRSAVRMSTVADALGEI